MSWSPPRRFTFAEELSERASALGDKVFLSFDDDTLTFADAERGATAAANQLLALGLEPGDTIALFAGSGPEWVTTWLGAARAGIRTMPVNLAFRGDYLVHQLRDAGARAILTDAALVPRLGEVAPGLPELRTALVLGEPEEKVDGVDFLPAADYLAAGDTDTVHGGRALAWNEPATIFSTSGTTGPSKGALLSQHYLCATADALCERYDSTVDDVMYAALPLFHVSGAQGIVLGSLVSGRTSVLDRAFHPSTCWDRVRAVGATQFFGVGAMIMMLWALPQRPDDATLPFHLMISAPVPAELHRPLEERYGCRVVVGYGLSEAMLIASHRADEPIVPGTVGRPSDLYEVRLVDDEDGDVPVGTPGEIVVRPRFPHVMFESYVGRPAETLAQFRNLWFHTGDLGRFDEGGNLSFVDRKKDAIRRRGENISSFEVERSVLAHRAVGECAAHAVASALSEDDVKICVVVKPGEVLTPQGLWEHCAVRMPRFAVPRYIEFVDALPKNVVGRVQKHLLRDRGVTPATWDREAPV